MRRKTRSEGRAKPRKGRGDKDLDLNIYRGDGSALVAFEIDPKLAPDLAGFASEIGGGAGQVIHHKFDVVDFSRPNPALFAGSSNLAAGGEEENGNYLLTFRDPAICSTYALEAIRLIDHHRFRAAMKRATKTEPVRLKTRSEDRSKTYFDPGSTKFRERDVFVV
jgi:hypothetical protein